MLQLIRIIMFWCGVCCHSHGVFAQPSTTQPCDALLSDAEVVRAIDENEHAIRGRGRGGLADRERRILAIRWVTVEICSALERTSLPEDDHSAKRFLFILGVLKDPSSAKFLRHYWLQRKAHGLGAWIFGWTSHRAYYALHTEEWEVISRSWQQHFDCLLNQQLEPELRVQILSAVDEWFFDGATTHLLLKYRSQPDLDAEEQVVVEGALWRRDKLDKGRLEGAFRRLSACSPKSFLYYAHRYPTVECVRPLIQQLTEVPELQSESEELLQRITFRQEPPEGWLRWFDRHGNTSRAQWLADGVGAVRQAIADGDWPSVKEFIQRYGNRNDELFIQWMSPLASQPLLTEDVIGMLQPSLFPKLTFAGAPSLLELRRRAMTDVGLMELLRSRLLLPVSWEASLRELQFERAP